VNGVSESTNWQPQMRLTGVIILVPAHLSYLEYSMSDALQQSRHFDELIVIASGFGRNYKRVEKVIEQLSLGTQTDIVLRYVPKASAGKNRNRAIDLASGDLLSFMDADDRYHPERNKTLLHYFRTSDCDVVLHSYIYLMNLDEDLQSNLIKWREHEVHLNEIRHLDTSTLYDSTFPNSIRDRKKELLGARSSLHFLPTAGFHAHHGHMTVKKKLLESDCRFHTHYFPRNEDAVMVRDLLWSHRKVLCISAALSAYRVGSSAVSQNLSLRLRSNPLWASPRFLKAAVRYVLNTR